MIRAAIQEPQSTETNKLRRSLHYLSIENELLHHKVDGLQRGLSTKQKRKKENKVFDLQQRQEYHSGAVF